MGDIPRQRNITIEFDCQFKVELPSSDYSTIMKAFLILLPTLLTDFFQKVLVGFAEYYMALEQKPFSCNCCGNDIEFTWKTRHGKATQILTWFRWITLQQLQILCKKCGKKQYITRQLLGMEPRKRVPLEVKRKFALMGALTSYRVAEKFGKMFGWLVDKMTIWRSVQQIGKELEFVVDGDEEPHCEADGTGIGIVGAPKRGKELKVLLQYKKGSGVRIAGVDIGNYNGSWNKLFKKSIKVIKKFRQPFLLVTDGDTSIFDALKGKVKVIVQRCLWHIPYQAKYVLWQDSVKRKSDEWLHVIAELMEICAIRRLVDCPDTIQAMIASKKKRLEEVIEFCRGKEFTHTATYLENARGDMFTAIENRLNGTTTSRVERVFRTVNMRVDVSDWSMEGVLNCVKVRLAYYYNGFDA